jgi:hypothetical protein
MSEQESRASKLLGGDTFSFAEAIGGWRGLIESALPGLVYVVAVLIVDEWLIPAAAALTVVAILVVIRLIQRSPVTQALSGVVGVLIGAFWAWRTGTSTGYFGPKLFANAAYAVGILISMAVRWPVAGVVMGFVHGTGTAWRNDPVQMRRAQWGTAVLAGMFGLRLAVQAPLYFAEEAAVLGTVNLLMGLPLFALTLWIVWLLVKNVGRKPEIQDQHPQP